jgi:hypothetical protein
VKNLPSIALGIGLVLTTVIVAGSRTDQNGATMLPLLALLLASEFAFVVTAVGAFICSRLLWRFGFTAGNFSIGACCGLLATHFMIRGMELWPQ